LGCWLACGITLVMFYVFFGAVSGSHTGRWPVVQFLQVLWLHWIMLGIVVAMVLCGSVVFAAPSSNSTICLIIVIGILLLGRHLNQVALHQPEPISTVLYTIYFLIPHLEWYDVRDFVIFDHTLIGWGNCALATLYGAAYSALLLFTAWLVFRRKPLTL
jgi:hypothetical protein